eukprot:1068628-Pyramimonas_sp.AAC.1
MQFAFALHIDWAMARVAWWQRFDQGLIPGHPDQLGHVESKLHDSEVPWHFLYEYQVATDELSLTPSLDFVSCVT